MKLVNQFRPDLLSPEVRKNLADSLEEAGIDTKYVPLENNTIAVFEHSGEFWAIYLSYKDSSQLDANGDVISYATATRLDGNL